MARIAGYVRGFFFVWIDDTQGRVLRTLLALGVKDTQHSYEDNAIAIILVFIDEVAGSARQPERCAVEVIYDACGPRASIPTKYEHHHTQIQEHGLLFLLITP